MAIACSNGSALALVEQAVQPGERIALRRFVDVGVDLQRRTNSVVPEDDLGRAWSQSTLASRLNDT